MQTICLVASKGGVGKTTHAATLAVALLLAHPEARVALIDADPQGSFAAWWNRRGASRLELYESDGAHLKEDVAELRADGVDFLIVDTPPGISRFQEEAIAVADLVIIPTQPCEVDLVAIEHTVRLALSAGKEPAILLNRAGFHTRLAAVAVRRLRESGHILLPVVHQRVDVAEAMGRGRVAIETAPSGAAAAELVALWLAVQELMRPVPRVPELRFLAQTEPA